MTARKVIVAGWVTVDPERRVIREERERCETA